MFPEPGLMAVRLTAKLQAPDGTNKAPDIVMLPLPGVAVVVSEPHGGLSPLGVATTRFDGRPMFIATPVSVVPGLGLMIEKARVKVPPAVSTIELGPEY